MQLQNTRMTTTTKTQFLDHQTLRETIILPIVILIRNENLA